MEKASWRPVSGNPFQKLRYNSHTLKFTFFKIYHSVGFFSVFTMLCNHQPQSKHRTFFFHRKKKHHPHWQSLPRPQPQNPRQPLTYFLSLFPCPFWTFHFIQHMAFCGWLLLSCGTKSSRFIHVVTCFGTPFFFIGE